MLNGGSSCGGGADVALLRVTERMCRPSGVDAGAQCVDAAHGTGSAIGAELMLRQGAVTADGRAARVLSKQFPRWFSVCWQL